jgi:hypothetical protein
MVWSRENISLRFNRQIFSYRPGTPLADYRRSYQTRETIASISRLPNQRQNA